MKITKIRTFSFILSVTIIAMLFIGANNKIEPYEKDDKVIKTNTSSMMEEPNDDGNKGTLEKSSGSSFYIPEDQLDTHLLDEKIRQRKSEREKTNSEYTNFAKVVGSNIETLVKESKETQTKVEMLERERRRENRRRKRIERMQRQMLEDRKNTLLRINEPSFSPPMSLNF